MRHVCIINKSILWKKKSVNRLLFTKSNRNRAGRNNTGRITVFSKGKKFHRFKNRLLQFKRFNHNIPGNVYRLEYDPGRSSFISLVLFKNNLFCYVLGVQNISLGSVVYSYDDSSFKDSTMDSYSEIHNKGDSHQLRYFSIGSALHNIDRFPNHGGVYSRSAGTYSRLLKKHYNLNKALIQLPSNKFIYLSLSSEASFGVVSNELHFKQVLGKAGRTRWLKHKSSVRGVAMNPVDHPHGGGEGKKNPKVRKTPWGKTNSWVNKKVLWKKYILKKK